MKQNLKRFLIAFLCIFMVCMFLGFDAKAEEVQEGEPPQEQPVATVTDAPAPQVQSTEKYDEKKGIASIRLMYVADTGARDIIKTGYAFFVGDESNIYLISCCETVILNEGERNNVAASHGVEADKVKTVIELVLKDDVIVELSIVNSSESMDFAILQPAKKLSACTTIRLCTDNNGNRKGDTVRTYDSAMEQIDCLIQDWTEINNAHYLMYKSDVAITKGMPLMNEDGEVIAIASSANKGNPEETYALQIDEVIEVLDVLAITYNAEIVVDTTALEEQILAFEELSKKKYTATSWKECQESYDNAKKLLSQVANGEVTRYTQDEINDATADLAGKIETLEKAGISAKTMILVCVLEGVILLIVIIVLSILLIVKTKKYKKLLKEEANNTVKAKEALKLSGRVTPGVIPNNTNMPVNRSLNEAGSNYQMTDVGGETSVLGADMNYMQSGYLESYVPSYPTLTRYKTGDTFVIKQNSVVIGSSIDSVDYYIRYNTNISRKHACILKFEDGYYIQDLETTNGTFVNGIRVAPGRYVKLESGNIIRLAEEEFEFKG